MPGCCPFYRWQKQYLRHLVEKKVSIGEQWQAEEEVGNEVEEDAGSLRPVGGRMEERLLAVKVDELVRAIKMLVVFLVCVVAVGVWYVLK
jgi:hypothetical protein